MEVEAQVPTQGIFTGHHTHSLCSENFIISALVGPNGGTDFDSPLNMARGLMERHNAQYDSFVFVMMSDGGSGYPSNGVESIKKSPARNKLKFKAIAYGGGSDSLLKMPHELEALAKRSFSPTSFPAHSSR